MYQGKFDAKNRGKRTAAPQEQPRRTRTEAPREPAPEKTRRRGPRVGGVIFYTLYFFCIAAFFLVMHQATGKLTDWLVDYQAAQPTTKSSQVYQQYFADPDWGAIYDMVDLEETEYEGRDAFVTYMTAKVAGQELDCVETSAGLSGNKKYLIKLGDEKIASFTLVGEEGEITDIPEWQLGTVEVYYERTHSVTVQIQEGETVYINGTALGEEDIIRIDSTLAENYLPEGVHGPLSYTYRVTDLLTDPEVTVQDADGSAVELIFDVGTETYVTPSSTETYTISSTEKELVLNAGKTYAKYMIEAATSGQLAQYFNNKSDIYKTITRMELWMQNSQGYEFTKESVSDYVRYSDDCFSARVELVLTVTRLSGTTKDYDVDTTLFFEKSGSSFKVTQMTGVDVQAAISQVRLTFQNEGTVLTSTFCASDAKSLTVPVLTAPEGKTFAGWFREETAEDGTTNYFQVFAPTESGIVTIPDGYELEPMTLYAIFEDAAAEGV